MKRTLINILIILTLLSTIAQATTYDNIINLSMLPKITSNCNINDYEDLLKVQTSNGLIGDHFKFLDNIIINKGIEDERVVNLFIEGEYKGNYYSYRLLYDKEFKELKILSYTINFDEIIKI